LFGVNSNSVNVSLYLRWKLFESLYAINVLSYENICNLIQDRAASIKTSQIIQKQVSSAFSRRKQEKNNFESTLPYLDTVRFIDFRNLLRKREMKLDLKVFKIKFYQKVMYIRYRSRGLAAQVQDFERGLLIQRLNFLESSVWLMQVSDCALMVK